MHTIHVIPQFRLKAATTHSWNPHNLCPISLQTDSCYHWQLILTQLTVLLTQHTVLLTQHIVLLTLRLKATRLTHNSRHSSLQTERCCHSHPILSKSIFKSWLITQLTNMDTQTTSCTHHSQLASNAMSAPNFRRKEEFTHNSCFTHWFVPDSVPSRHNSSQIGSGEQNESTNHYNPVLCAATTPKHRFCHHCWLFLLPAMPFFWKVGEHFKEIMSLANQDHFFPLFKPPSFRAPPRRIGWGVHVWSWCLQLDLHTGCHILLTILTNALLFTGNQQREKKKQQQQLRTKKAGRVCEREWIAKDKPW